MADLDGPEPMDHDLVMEEDPALGMDEEVPVNYKSTKDNVDATSSSPFTSVAVITEKQLPGIHFGTGQRGR